MTSTAGTDKVVDAIGLSPDDYTEFPEMTSSITAAECKLSVCLGAVCNVVIKHVKFFIFFRVIRGVTVFDRGGGGYLHIFKKIRSMMSSKNRSLRSLMSLKYPDQAR